MNRHAAVLLVLGLLAGPGLAAPARPPDPQAPADLRLKWTAGQRQHQRLAMSMLSETSGGPLPAPVRQEVTLNMEYDLAAVGVRDGGGQELTLTLGDLGLVVQAGGREVVRFDTRVGAPGPENGTASFMRSLVGTRLQCLLNASNSVERVEGWRDSVRQATASASAPGRSALAGVFTEGYFRQLADFARVLPQRSVRPGESWSHQQDIALGTLGRVLLDMTYQFQGWETRAGQDCAAVRITGTARSAAPGDGGSSALGRMGVEQGKIRGTYWFNPAAGRMVETALDQDVTLGIEPGRLSPPADANAAGDGKPGRITARFQQKTQIQFSVPPTP